LQQAIRDDEGLILLTGQPGVGKTLLCHRLLEAVGSDAACVFLTNSHVCNCAGLLQAILYDLSLPYEGRSEQELRLAVTDYLLQNFAAGRRALILVDEAQHLRGDLLEELRLLGNLEARQGKAVQVVLAAQPAVQNVFHQPHLSGFRQRLAVRVLLEPLDAHESADYLCHQLRVAGGKPEQILAAEAIELLVGAAGGIPRRLNQAAHQALTLACEAGNTIVDAEAALEALAVLGLNADKLPAAEREDAAGAPAGMVLTLADVAETDAEAAANEDDVAEDRMLVSPPRPA
jgi:type II secretory pathway predicted ATPase ExeA